MTIWLWFLGLPLLAQAAIAAALLTATGVFLASIVNLFTKYAELKFLKNKMFIEERAKDLKLVNEYIALSYSKVAVDLKNRVKFIQDSAADYESIAKVIYDLKMGNESDFHIGHTTHFLAVIEQSQNLRNTIYDKRTKSVAFDINVRPWFGAPAYITRMLGHLGISKVYIEDMMLNNLINNTIEIENVFSKMDTSKIPITDEVIQLIYRTYRQQLMDEDKIIAELLIKSINAGHSLRAELYSGEFLLFMRELWARAKIGRENK